MSDVVKTGAFVLAAAVSVVLVVVTAPTSGLETRFQDEGTLFFPDFTDPAQAASLEVIEIDSETVSERRFRVEVDEAGRWAIPSHDGYPADARSRMADSAALFVGLRRGRAVAETKAAHARLGVLDPTDREASVDGRGTKVTFRDDGGNVLGTLILGRDVEDRPGLRYAREPKKMRTYTVELEAEISARFVDWIETDLLDLSQDEIAQITFHRYSVDEQRGEVRDLDKKVIVKKGAGDAWSVEGAALDEEANEEVIEAAVEVLAHDLKIVDVQAKPEGIDARLRALGSDLALLNLEARGFFVGRGEVYSNMGDVLVQTDEGVRYTLRFGEIASLASEEDSSDEGSSDEDGEGEEGAPKAKSANRYLMVTAEFDEEALPRPEGPELTENEVEHRKTALTEIEKLVARVDGWSAKNDGAWPESLEAVFDEDDAEREELLADPWERPYRFETSEEGFVIRCLAADGAEGGENAAADISSDAIEDENALLDGAEAVRKWKEKTDRGRIKAEKLTKRFGPWYYVIDAASFEALHLSREDVVQEREVEDAGGGDDDPIDDPFDDDSDPDDGGGEDEDGDDEGEADGGSDE